MKIETNNNVTIEIFILGNKEEWILLDKPEELSNKQAFEQFDNAVKYCGIIIENHCTMIYE